MTKSAPWSWLLLCAAIAVSAGVWTQLGSDPVLLSSSDDVAQGPDSAQAQQDQRNAPVIPTLALKAAAPRSAPLAAAKHAELASMSETFRDGVFLVAIRDSGYVCYQLIGSSTSGGEDPIWTVSCDDTLGYLIGVDPSGAVAVEPMIIGDGPAPVRTGTQSWQPEDRFQGPSPIQ